MGPRRPLPLVPAALACLAALGLPGRIRAEGDARVSGEVLALTKHARDPNEQEKRTAAVRRLGQIGGAEAAAALVPLFQDPFEHLADHAVGAWITMLKGGNSAETQTWLAREGLASKSPAVRAGAAVALGLAGGTELADAWTAALAREEDPAVLVALARGGCAARGGPLVPAAFVPLLAHADGRVVLAAAEAVACAGAEAEAPLRKALGHREALARAGAVDGLLRAGLLTEVDLARVLADRAFEPRIALADRLERSPSLLPFPGRGEEVLRALLADASWRVRTAAIEAALRVWQPRVIPPLIDRLTAEQGRARDHLVEALRTLTTLEQPDDVDVWRRWWSGRGESLDLGPRPPPDEHGRIRRPVAAPGPGAPRAPGGTHTAQFFDLPLRSQRMAFVFDLSGSMRDPFGARGGPSRLEVTRTEFARLVGMLPETAAVDLFVYRYPTAFPPDPDLTRALGKIAPLTAATRKKLIAWSAQQPAVGWGAFYEALDLASEEEVDTIVLLSDGKPSRGKYDRGFRLIDEFVRVNRFRRVTVDTILVGENDADRGFMQSLAAATGGRMTEARPAR
jgi:HEAT repeat protein